MFACCRGEKGERGVIPEEAVWAREIVRAHTARINQRAVALAVFDGADTLPAASVAVT
jgi:hypothetical protein